MKVYSQKHTKNTKLNELRLEKGLSVTTIAKQIGLSIGCVSYMFNHAEVPSKKNLKRLAPVFDMGYEELCDYLNVDPESPAIKKGHYETFWNVVKEESGLTLKEIAEGIGKKNNQRLVGKYFTGELMPKDATITTICNLFDVDFEQGKEEFKKASLAWRSKRTERQTKAKVVKEEVATETPVVNMPKEPIVIEKDGRTLVPTKSAPAKVEPKKIDTSNIESLIYGKIDYDEFEAIRTILRKNTAKGMPLEKIYGKVDCDTYNKVYDLIKS